MKSVVDLLLDSIMPGKVLDVQVGLFRTAVVVETRYGLRCGLAASLISPSMENGREIAIRQAGCLHLLTSRELADLVHSERTTEVTIGLAAINALLPPFDERYPVSFENAEDYILRSAPGKKVAVVGHFPFVDHLPNYADKSWCLELDPRPGDLPAEQAPEILPQADLVAITGTTIINNTINGLLNLCRRDAEVIMVGPSTPMSPVMFDLGITMCAGILVDEPKKVLTGISQGATLRQLYQEGWVRYANIRKENHDEH